MTPHLFVYDVDAQDGLCECGRGREAHIGRLLAQGAFGTTHTYWQEFRCYACSPRVGRLLAADKSDEEARRIVTEHFRLHDLRRQQES